MMVDGETAEIAEAANQLAQHATAHAIATGVLMDATLDALIENGSLNRNEANSILQDSYTYVSGPEADQVRNQPIHDLVRQIYQQMAEKRGVALKEPT